MCVCVCVCEGGGAKPPEARGGEYVKQMKIPVSFELKETNKHKKNILILVNF